MNDDWRIRIELEEEHAEGLLDRLGLDLGSEARQLADELQGRRLVVSRDDETLFVYAGSRAEAERAQAQALADKLEAEGHGVVRRHTYILVGAATEEEAQELAKRLHGQAEASGELVYETLPQNPFVIFGGLGGSGTPL